MGVDVFLFHVLRHQSSSGGPGDVGDVFLLFLQSLALNVIPKALRSLCKGKGGAGPYGPNGKKKKKGGWWKALLGTLLAIAVIFFGTVVFIMHAIAPSAGSISLNQLINTPKEYAGKEFNLLVVGIDRSTETGQETDSQVDDGMTDMILYLHFNNETGQVKMLQIPRNIFAVSYTHLTLPTIA